MKRLLAILMLIVLAVPTLAQDGGYSTHIYQSNTLCPFKITLTATDPIGYYQLKFDETVVARGGLEAGESSVMYLPMVQEQWYILLIESEGGYALDTGLACDEEIPADGTPAPVDPVIEQRIQESLKPLMEMLIKALLEN